MAKKKSIFEGSLEKEGIKAEKDEFLEPEEHKGTHQERMEDISAGEEAEDVYTEEGRESMIEGDEITPLEEGFSEGAEEKGELAKCSSCEKILSQEKEEVVEKEVKGELMFFCSNSCAEKFKS